MLGRLGVEVRLSEAHVSIKERVKTDRINNGM